jgi:transposase-like protein
MVFRQYSKDVKLVAVKMCLRGLDRTEINNQLDMSISVQSLRRWRLLYQRTLEVICNPAFYERRGRPVAVSREESQFILDALELESTLYLDEIQAHLNTINGHEIPISTIHNEIKYRLLLTSKKARTVHPSQCPFQRADYICQIAFIPPDHLVFLGKYIFDFCSVMFCLLTCFLSDEAGVSMKTHCQDQAWAPRER